MWQLHSVIVYYYFLLLKTLRVPHCQFFFSTNFSVPPGGERERMLVCSTTGAAYLRSHNYARRSFYWGRPHNWSCVKRREKKKKGQNWAFQVLLVSLFCSWLMEWWDIAPVLPLKWVFPCETSVLLSETFIKSAAITACVSLLARLSSSLSLLAGFSWIYKGIEISIGFNQNVKIGGPEYINKTHVLMKDSQTAEKWWRWCWAL